MTNAVKSIFNTATGLFTSPDPEGPSDAELAAQTARRSDEEQAQGELISRGPSRKQGRARKIGRQLLTFLGPSTSKSSSPSSGGAERKSFRGPGPTRNRIR